MKNKKLYVTINVDRCEVLGRMGMYHVSVDVSDRQVKLNDEVHFEVSPMFVDSNIEREYV